MPSVGWTDGGTAGYEFEEQKKDFSLFSTKFKSNRSLKNFSQNIDPSKKDNDDDEDIDEKLKKMPTKGEVNYFNPCSLHLYFSTFST